MELHLHDTAYHTSYPYRGNATWQSVDGIQASVQYDIGGVAVKRWDALGHTVSLAVGSGTGYSLPSAMTPNDNPNLATAIGYDADLRAVSVSGPAGSATLGYDNYGRPSTSSGPDGVVTGTPALGGQLSANSQTPPAAVAER